MAPRRLLSLISGQKVARAHGRVLNSNRDRLGCRNLGFLGMMPKRDERIAFGIIARNTSLRHIVGPQP